MSVRLVAITRPEGDMSVDEFVAFVARVSNPGNQNNKLTAPKLIKYLIDHSHWSPFEMVNMVFEIYTTRDIGRQLLRHKSMAFQEFSQRYADPTTQLGFLHREARLQDPKNRQNSIETDDETIKGTWKVIQDKCIEQTIIDYKWAIDHGIAKEQARAILPEGLTLSWLYGNMNLRTAIHYCSLRTEEHGTQKEHVEISQGIWKIVLEKFPSLQFLNGENNVIEV